MSTASALRAWKLRRLQARHQRHLRDAEYWRGEARRLAMLAYEVPDMLAEPMKWGRLQNAANWANHSECQHRDEARRIERLIDAAELAT